MRLSSINSSLHRSHASRVLSKCKTEPDEPRIASFNFGPSSERAVAHHVKRNVNGRRAGNSRPVLVEDQDHPKPVRTPHCPFSSLHSSLSVYPSTLPPLRRSYTLRFWSLQATLGPRVGTGFQSVSLSLRWTSCASLLCVVRRHTCLSMSCLLPIVGVSTRLSWSSIAVASGIECTLAAGEFHGGIPTATDSPPITFWGRRRGHHRRGP